ncbi:MAG: glycosyltransferase family 39 protein [Planctomycetaceae bacterium]
MDSELSEQSGFSLLWIVAGISLVASICLANLPERTWVFSDTAHYMSVARLLQSGDGISTDLIYYSEQSQVGSIPAPQTVFPPGYPALVAAIASVTPLDHHDAGRLICILAYASIAPLIFLLGTSGGIKPSLSAYAALLWLPIVAAWMPLWCYSSDVLFVSLTLASILCFARADGHWRGLLAAGLLAACAVAVRYAGVFLGITFGVIFLLRHRIQLLRSIRDGSFAIGPPLLTTLAMFARNSMLIGHWKGGNKYAGHSLGYVLKMFYYCACEFTGFSKTELMEGSLFCIAQVVFVVALLSLIIFGIATRRAAVGRELAGRMGAMLIYAPLSIAMLIFLHARSSSGMTPRLFLPVIPCLLLGFAILFQWVFENYQRLRLVAVCVVVSGMLGVLVGQTRCMADFRTRALRGVATRQILNEPITETENLRQYLQARCDSKNTLLSSMPQMTHLFVERPSVGLPTGFYNVTGEPWSFERVERLAQRFKVRYVLLLTHPDTSVHHSTFFKKLAEGNKPEWLASRHVGENFQLFEVVPCDEDTPQSHDGRSNL